MDCCTLTFWVRTLNALIFMFSFSLVVLASYTIANFDRETNSLLSRGDFGWLLFGGLVGVLISFLGCYGSKHPVKEYNLLFCYFFWLTVILGVLSMGFYLYRIFVKNLESAADGDIETAFRIEAAKEFNDFLLSIFVFCCTGCDQAVLDTCVRNITVFDFEEGNCNVVDVYDEEGLANGAADCFIPPVCSRDQVLADNSGLGEGCFINSQVVPSYEIGDNFCIFFDEFARNDGDKPVVGPADEGSCGGGNPKNFVDDVFEFMSKNYYVIATFWGLGLCITFLAWLGSFAMLSCPHYFAHDD